MQGAQFKQNGKTHGPWRKQKELTTTKDGTKW